jgi:hypothetical protein
MKTNIMTFATHNDTDKYVIIVDGRIGIFGTAEKAAAVYAKIGGGAGDDGLDETPFGSADFLMPQTSCLGCHHTEHSFVSEYISQASDVEKYIDDQNLAAKNWVAPASSGNDFEGLFN